MTRASKAETKARILGYRSRHPNATIRQIQTALGISSPSVVHWHLKSQTKAQRIEILERALRRADDRLSELGDTPFHAVRENIHSLLSPRKRGQGQEGG